MFTRGKEMRLSLVSSRLVEQKINLLGGIVNVCLTEYAIELPTERIKYLV